MDIISNEVVFLGGIENTLIKLITTNFMELKGKNKTINKSRKKNKPVLNSISSILINSAVKKVKDENKDIIKEENLEETTEEEHKDKKEVIVNGGYGTISTHYGISPGAKYTNYDKIWSHIGSFRAYAAHEGAKNSNEVAMNNGESSREMVSTETMDKAAKHFKYFVSGDTMGDIGFVPPVGININSKDWEKYRLMTQMSIYRPLIKLMNSVA